MTSGDQRSILEAFSRDFARECHNLVAADLGRYPQLVWQQLYNRLQWRGGPAERVVRPALPHHSRPDSAPWLHVLTRLRESEALVRTYAGHGDPVTACAFSPDGQTVASGDAGGTLRLWAAHTGAARAILRGHGGAITACEFSPDGRRLVSASTDSTLTIWDLDTGTGQFTLRGGQMGVTACAFSSNGQLIASGGGDQAVRIWNTATGGEEATLTGHEWPIASCEFAPDGRRIVSRDEQGTVCVWDVVEKRSATGGARARLADLLVFHTPGTTAMRAGAALYPQRRPARTWSKAFGCGLAGDGRTLITRKQDYSLGFWDIETGKERTGVAGDHVSVKAGVRLSADGSVTTVSAVTEGVCVRGGADDDGRLLVGHTGAVNAVALSPDGQTIVSASDDLTVKLWNLQSGVDGELAGHGDAVVACGFSPDGRTVVSASADTTLKLWNAVDGSERATLAEHKVAVSSFCFGDDGRTLVSTAGDATVRIWDVDDGRQRMEAPGQPGRPTAHALSPDGHALACAKGSSFGDDTLMFWSADSGAEQATLTGQTGSVRCCAFSPDGQTVTSLSGDGVFRAWDASTGKERFARGDQYGRVTAARFSPDGRTIAAAHDDGRLLILDALDGSERGTWLLNEELPQIRATEAAGREANPTGMRQALQHPDGTVEFLAPDPLERLRADADPLFFVNADAVWIGLCGTLRVVDAGSGVVRFALAAAASGPFVLSPDETRVACQGHDGTLSLRHATTGTEEISLAGHRDGVTACAFSPGGSVVVSVGADKTLRLWNAKSGDEIVYLPTLGTPPACAFSPAGGRLCCGDGGGTVYVLEPMGTAQDACTCPP